MDSWCNCPLANVVTGMYSDFLLSSLLCIRQFPASYTNMDNRHNIIWRVPITTGTPLKLRKDTVLLSMDYGMKPSRNVCCLSRTKLRSKREIQAQCSALNQVSLCLILLTGGQGAGGAGPGAAPPPRRDNGPLSPDCTETKDWFKYCLRIGQGGRAGPRPAAKTKPGRKSGCHIDLAWAVLGWLGWAGLGEGAASRGCWRPLARPPPTLFQPRPGPAPRSSHHQI